MDKYPSEFVVDGRKLIPHLSLWHIRTSESKINKLGKKLKQIVKNQKPIKIKSAGFVAPQEINKAAHFTVSNSRALTSLQQRVFEKVYLLKTGIIHPPGRKAWAGKKLKQARKYSRPLGFGPHFTAVLLKNIKDALRVQKRMKKVKFSFIAKEIYICRVNRWWQVDKIIKKINFSNVR